MSFPTGVPNGRRHIQNGRSYQYSNGVWLKEDKQVVNKSNQWTTSHGTGQHSYSGNSGIFALRNPVQGTSGNSGGLVFINMYADNNPLLDRNSYVRFRVIQYTEQVVQLSTQYFDELLYDYGARVGGKYSGFGFSYYIDVGDNIVGALKVYCEGELNIRNAFLGTTFTWQAFVYGTTKQ